MVQRVYMSKNPPRLIVTKPGYEASPSVSEIGKSFDSNWFDGGGIRWVLNGVKEKGARINFPYTLTKIPVITPIYDQVWSGSGTFFQNNSYWWDNGGWPAPPRNVARDRTPVRMDDWIPSQITTSYLVTASGTNISGLAAPDKYIVWSF